MRPELQDIVDEVARLLDHPVTLDDRSFNLVAFVSHGDAIDAVRQRSILERKSSPEVRRWFEGFGIATATAPLRTPSSPERGLLGRLCLPARWKDVTYGYLWALDDRHQIDDAVLPAAMVLAERAGALMAQQARTREDLGFLLQNLLATDPETVERAADEIAARRIIRRGSPVTAVELRLVRRPGQAEEYAAAAMNLWSLPRGVVAGVGADPTTLLVPRAGGDLAAAHDLAERARALYLERLEPGAEVDLVAGIGSPRADLAGLRGSWEEARQAARVLDALPRLGPTAAWQDLGVYRLLRCGPEAVLTEAVLDTSVRRLLDQGSAEVLETARTFLHHAGNVQRTAAALNVHRQTVYHRLKRVEQLTGLDLTHGDDLLLLHLGLTLAPALARH